MSCRAKAHRRAVTAPAPPVRTPGSYPSGSRSVQRRSQRGVLPALWVHGNAPHEAVPGGESRAMAESVPVRCPACGREHRYTAPTFPCACGAPLAPPVLPGAPPEVVRHRSWNDSWVRLRCQDCGRADQWPQPEFDCPCGALVRLPVDGEAADGSGREASVGRAGAPEPTGTVPPPPTTRPPFRPVTIRTAAGRADRGGAVPEVAGLRGGTAGGRPYRQRHRPARGRPGRPGRPDHAADAAAGRRVPVAQLRPRGRGRRVLLARRVRARRADARRPVGRALFVMDLTGTPQPVNDAADHLLRTGPAL